MSKSNYASEHWQKSAKAWMIFVKQQLGRLNHDMKMAMMAYADKLERNEKLAMYEVNEIERAYELIMKSYGLPTVTRKHDVDTRMKLRH
jgi:hypothetical protein